jgi:hypothetical protein
VKNVRINPREGALATPKAQFGTPADRDAAILTGNFTENNAEPIDDGGSVPIGNPNQPNNAQQQQLPPGLMISNAIGRTINKAIIRSIYVNDKNQITSGEQTFTGQELKDQGLEKALRIEQFEVSAETVTIKIDVGPGSPMSLLGPIAASAEETAAVVVTDTNGKRYEPIGYIYDDGTKNQKTVRFYPNEPMRTLKEIPTLSRSRPNDKLILIFRCDKGVTLKGFVIGNKEVVSFPPILLNQSQGSR